MSPIFSMVPLRWSPSASRLKRGRPLSGNKFCSLKCLDIHLQEVENATWCAIGETVTHEGRSGLTVHRIAVSEREKSERTFRHRDSTEMDQRPPP